MTEDEERHADEVNIAFQMGAEWERKQSKARIEKLEAALREIAESAWDCTGDTCDHCKPDNCPNRDIARKALEGKDE